MTHEFILRYSVPGNAADYLDALYDAGCNDATVSLCDGKIIVDFSREADTIDEAVASAKADVQSAIPTAILIED